jgi:hypothetical protein
MDWNIKGLNSDPEDFRGFKTLSVLIDVDGPRLFTAETRVCNALFMLVDENNESARFVVAPTSDAIIAQLENGTVSVRNALDQPVVWVLETDHTLEPQNAWRTTLGELPESVLPAQGRMLWPHLQPAFRLRAIGEGLSHGTVPASVIRQVVEGASTALRKAAAHVSKEPGKQGRASNSRKRLYDLPVQHFAYNSFEVAFSLPPEQQETLLQDEDDAEMQQIGTALAEAISSSNSAENDDANLQALEIELLEALEKLVPPLSGTVTEFEVGGTILGQGDKTFRLDRDTSKRVKKVLQTVRTKEEKITTLEGLVAEMDRDNLTFTLRQTSDHKDHVCSFSAEVFDEVMDAFVNENRVAISGRETLKSGNIDVSIFNEVGEDALQG